MKFKFIFPFIIKFMQSVNQVVLLAGGKGTRMREMTEDLPKPMVRIGNFPVLDHLMKIFNNFGEFKFIVCTGYLEEKIREYYKNKDGVEVVFTGIETQTGGRIKKIADKLDDNFIVTYGDGLANVNINNLIDFHFSQNTIGTMTVTNPTSRFGLVEFNNNKLVERFVEKPKLQGFVNIGFMVFKNKFLEYLDSNSVLESNPLTNLASAGELSAYIHDGYFEPMDTYREYLNMNKLLKSGNPPWNNF